MVAKRFIFCLGILFALSANAQNKFGFEATNQYLVIVNGDSLPLAWAGGFNQPQFSTIDLNGDGFEDLLAFDRSGNRIIPFLNILVNGSRKYRYAQEYVKHFPEIKEWMLLRDYNCDGKKDIFCFVPGGVGVYENTSIGSDLSFSWAIPNSSYLKSNYGSSYSNLYVLATDIPGIIDLDEDGDLDIFTFAQGNIVEWHENIANCGLDYKLNTSCWGRFEEGSLNNTLFLDACQGIAKTENPNQQSSISNKGQHAGSSILIIDLDGNGLKDIVLGDVSFSNGVAAYNTGITDSAFMSSQDTTFPAYDTPVDINLFPGFFYEDVDFDSKKDLIVAPNVNGSKNVNATWYYKNTGTNLAPVFNFQDSAFLQKHMIDLGEDATPVLVDIDFDGKVDLFISNYGESTSLGGYASYISYYQNTGSKSKPEFTLITKDLNGISQLNLGYNLHPTFGDLDGDADLDMLVGLDNGTLTYFENTGTLTNPVFTFVGNNYQSIDVGNKAAPCLFDVDGDFYLDLVIGEEIGNLNYYKNNGTVPATFSLVTQNFGGVNVAGDNAIEGNSKPVLFRKNDTLNLFVGSLDNGVLQYDSLEKVLALPTEIIKPLGTGTTATTGFDTTPFGTAKRNGRNQLLFRASELIAQGFKYGKITKLSFFITNTPSNYVSQGFSIKMKNVNKQVINQWETGLTQVYDYINPFVNGWNDITLSVPFLWDGKSDLIIEICFSKNFPTTNIPVQYTDVGFAANAYGDVSNWNMNTQNGCAMPYLATSTLRPNIKLSLTPTFVQTDHVLKNGYNNAPAVANLNNDGFIDMILGNKDGGVTFYKGKQYTPDIGIKENFFGKTQALVAYPNPTTSIVTIETPEEFETKNATIKLYSLTGQLLIVEPVQKLKTEMNVAHVPNGIYVLHLASGTKNYHQRIVVQH